MEGTEKTQAPGEEDPAAVWDELRRIEGAIAAAVQEALAEVQDRLNNQQVELVVVHLEEGPAASPPPPGPIVGDVQIIPGCTQVVTVYPPYGGPTLSKEERTAPKLVFKRPAASVEDAVQKGVERALSWTRSKLHDHAQMVLLQKDLKKTRDELGAALKEQQMLQRELQNERVAATVLTDAVKQLRHEDEAFKKLEQKYRVLRIEVGERRARELLGEGEG